MSREHHNPSFPTPPPLQQPTPTYLLILFCATEHPSHESRVLLEEDLKDPEALLHLCILLCMGMRFTV